MTTQAERSGERAVGTREPEITLENSGVVVSQWLRGVVGLVNASLPGRGLRAREITGLQGEVAVERGRGPLQFRISEDSPTRTVMGFGAYRDVSQGVVEDGAYDQMGIWIPRFDPPRNDPKGKGDIDWLGRKRSWQVWCREGGRKYELDFKDGYVSSLRWPDSGYNNNGYTNGYSAEATWVVNFKQGILQNAQVSWMDRSFGRPPERFTITCFYGEASGGKPDNPNIVHIRNVCISHGGLAAGSFGGDPRHGVLTALDAFADFARNVVLEAPDRVSGDRAVREVFGAMWRRLPIGIQSPGNG